MTQDRLTREVMSRFRELGLPDALFELAEFREHFFDRKWVMFVRNHDHVADVHLVEPQASDVTIDRR